MTQREKSRRFYCCLTLLLLVGGVACRADTIDEGSPQNGRVELATMREIVLSDSGSFYVSDFPWPRHVSFAPDGTFAIGDRMSSRVLTFSGNGDLLGTQGRSGQGPGEYEGIVAVEWDPKGRLWVLDQSSRVTILNGSLEVDTTLTLYRDGPAGYIKFADNVAVVAFARSRNEGMALHTYDVMNLSLMDSMSPRDPLAREPYVGGVYLPMFAVTGDSMLYGSNLSYPLRVLSIEGDSLASFGNPPPSLGSMRIPELGEFAADPRAGQEWLRSFGRGGAVWLLQDTLVVVEHRIPPRSSQTPEEGNYRRAVDVYDRRTLRKLVEDLEVPGRIVDSHDGLLWIVTIAPPEPWTLSGFGFVSVPGDGLDGENPE